MRYALLSPLGHPLVLYFALLSSPCFLALLFSVLEHKCLSLPSFFFSSFSCLSQSTSIGFFPWWDCMSCFPMLIRSETSSESIQEVRCPYSLCNFGTTAHSSHNYWQLLLHLPIRYFLRKCEQCWSLWTFGSTNNPLATTNLQFPFVCFPLLMASHGLYHIKASLLHQLLFKL